MKYFTVTCNPMKSKHSLKKDAKEHVFYVTGSTKKAAQEKAKEELLKVESEDAQNYRQPIMEEIDHDAYMELKEVGEAVAPAVSPAESWEHGDPALSYDDLTLVCALVVLYGFDGSDYTADEIEAGSEVAINALGTNTENHGQDEQLTIDSRDFVIDVSGPVKSKLNESDLAKLADHYISPRLGGEEVCPVENREEAIKFIIEELELEYQIDTINEQPKTPAEAMAIVGARIGMTFEDEAEGLEDQFDDVKEATPRIEIAQFNIYPPYFAEVGILSKDGDFYPSFEIRERKENGHYQNVIGNKAIYKTKTDNTPYSTKDNAVTAGLRFVMGNLKAAFDGKKLKPVYDHANSLLVSWFASNESLLERFNSCTVSGANISDDEYAALVERAKQRTKPLTNEHQPMPDNLNGPDDLDDDLDLDDLDDLDDFDIEEAEEKAEGEPSFIGVTCANCGGSNINDDEQCNDCLIDKIDELPETEGETAAYTIDSINEQIKALKVGESLILEGVPNDLYQLSIGVSKGKLDTVLRDPSLIKWGQDCPVDKDKLTTAHIGNAYHCAVLEPHLFASQFAIMPPLNLRTNAGKEEKAKFLELIKDKKQAVLTNDENQQVFYMAASVNAHPMARQLLQAKGQAESSIWYRASETVVFKIRPDYRVVIGEVHHIMDLKSTDYCDKFERSVEAYNYHIQDAFYSYVYSLVFGVMPVFSFCVTQKVCEFGRYPTRLMMLHESDKIEGRARMDYAIGKYIECLESNVWGGFETIKRSYFDTRDDLTAENERSSRKVSQ